MTRGSRGLVIGCGAIVALGLFAGCAQQQQRSRTRSPAAGLVEDTATTAVNAVSAATGAAADVVNGAATATATGTSKPKRALPAGAFYWSEVGMKRNGRGGYTASPAQKARHKAVQRQAMAYRKYMNGRGAKLGAAPTTRPAGR